MGYTLPLEQISLNDYRQLLRQQNLLPGRRVLLEQLDERFALLTSSGLTNLAQLSAVLATIIGNCCGSKTCFPVGVFFGNSLIYALIC